MRDEINGEGGSLMPVVIAWKRIKSSKQTKQPQKKDKKD